VKNRIIPLQALADQGITLTNEDKFAIGLGSKSGMAAADGSGTVYIEDIQLNQPSDTAAKKKIALAENNIRITIKSGPILFNAVWALYILLPIMDFKFPTALENVLICYNISAE
jgi:hypothetical protein